MKMELSNLIPYFYSKKKGRTKKVRFLEAFKEQITNLWLKNLDKSEIDALMLVKVLATILIISLAFYGSLIFSIFLIPLGIYLLKEEIKIKKESRNNAYLGKFKEALLSISFALDVGYSIENAFREALVELEKTFGKEDEISRDFYNIVRRLDRNENIEDLLSDFASKQKSEDINYFVEVFRYSKRTGGNLIEIIKNTTKQISEKWAVANEIKTQISAKKMEQRIMSYIPIVIIFYLKLTTRGYLDCLYFNPLGIIIMTICLVIYGISVKVSKRIMDIEI